MNVVDTIFHFGRSQYRMFCLTIKC